jgi:PAS domain S-box-containing protein
MQGEIRLPPPLWFLGIAVAVATAYAVTGALALSTATLNPYATAVWPPAGIGLAAILLFGYRLWPAILAGAFAVSLPIDWAPVTSLLIAAGDTVEALVGAYLVSRFAGGARAFEHPLDVGRFAVLAGFSGPIPSATIGVTALWLGGAVRGPEYTATWLTWWVGDGAGALVFAPLLLLWAQDRSAGALRRHPLEAAGLVLSVVLVGQVVFGPWHVAPSYPLMFLMFPLLLWAAFGFGPREVASAVVVLAIVAIGGTVQGFGPFALLDRNQSLLFLQIFLATLAVTNLSVAAVVAERRREQARLQAAWATQSRLGAIVDGSDDAIVSKTLEGIITSWNPAAERMFGFAAAEALGQPIALIIPAERLPEEEVVLARIRRGEKVDHFETVRRRKDGSQVEVSLTISPVRGPTGTIIGASKIARDIGATKRHERERAQLLARERAARTEAEAANRAKDDFLATLSHELRTPLSAMLGWVEIMRFRGDPATIAQGLERIERNARVQVRLIEDLLDLSRIAAGKMRLETRPIDLGPVVLAAVETVRTAAEAKGVSLASHIGADAVVMGDPGRLQQVVWNLLSNAVKFTARGGLVEVTVERSTSLALIRVTDTGQGIKPEALPYVFERLRQADSSLTRFHGGLGLGLAIVRYLVELQGGTVSAESPGEGRGATFSVMLPLLPIRVDDRTRWAPPGRITYQRPRCDGVSVLVVDDEPDARELLRAFLEDCGARVTVTETVRAARELLEQRRFDVIVTDLAMPGEDGFALAQHVRARPADRGGRLPLVALTAHAGTEMRVRALVTGFDAYVAKPVEPAELVAVVARLANPVRG